MGTPTNIYALVAPLVLVLVAAEFLYCLWKRNGYYSFSDSVIGLGTAIIAQCVNVAVAIAVLAVYGWIHERGALFRLEPTLLNYALGYLGVDFLFYWFHRAGHRINLLWAMHVPHHSAEELNYAVALRSSFTQRAASFLFYWPLAILGFSPAMILPLVALNLVLQFLPHTRVIPKLPGWIDRWLNTPYHHRIHHAANPRYWDKNYGGTFIFWDRWFGSYADETEPVYYGVSVPPRSWDPTYLNLHWFHVLWRDCRAATHWSDKLTLWFRPPGFRPRNLGPYEKPYVPDGSETSKYRPRALLGARPYLLAQVALGMALMYFVVANGSRFDAVEKVGLTAFLWIGVTGWGAILESRRWAQPLELARIPALGIFLAWTLPKHYADLAPARDTLVLVTTITAIQLFWVFALDRNPTGEYASH